MDILIFDMDGVLLEARGYHRALQETVRLAGEHLSVSNIQLTQQDIHKFESIGISSEWHSSALCMAFLNIQTRSSVSNRSLSLDELYRAIQDQPLEMPASERGLATIKQLCKKYNVDSNLIVPYIANWEDIDRSLTMQWFQELVLGTESYQNRYKKVGRFNTQSYLRLYDLPLLSPDYAEIINNWVRIKNGRAAIMTNRPSVGPGDNSGSPEAEMGLDLVQLSMIPIIGFGEMSWLADSIEIDPGRLVKPNSSHALAAILSATHMERKLSLITSILDPVEWSDEILERLHGRTITVFEDTPAGLVSVSSAVKGLRKAGIDISIRSIGISKGGTKKVALEAQGAAIFGNINSALKRSEEAGVFA